MHYYSHYHSPLGPMTMASDGEHLIGLWFDGQKHDRATLDEQAVREEGLLILQETRQWLDAYFGGPAGGPHPSTPALAVEGSPFRRMVLEILRSIPSGQTTTYARIAAQVARRTGRERVSAQAVGGAVGRNPISLIIPCHRVVGSSGSLTGYASGIDRKRRLLEMEGADLSGMFMPGQPRRARAEPGPRRQAPAAPRTPRSGAVCLEWEPQAFQIDPAVQEPLAGRPPVRRIPCSTRPCPSTSSHP